MKEFRVIQKLFRTISLGIFTAFLILSYWEFSKGMGANPPPNTSVEGKAIEVRLGGALVNAQVTGSFLHATKVPPISVPVIIESFSTGIYNYEILGDTFGTVTANAILEVDGITYAGSASASYGSVIVINLREISDSGSTPVPTGT